MKYFLVALILVSATSAAQAQQSILIGKMVHTDIEGGCWYLDVNGKHYELTGDTALTNQVHVDGAQVTVLTEAAKGAMSPCMIGEIVHVVEVDQVLTPEALHAQDLHPVDPMIMTVDINGRIKRTADHIWYVLTPKGAKYRFVDSVATYHHLNRRFHHVCRVVHGPEHDGWAGNIVKIDVKTDQTN